MSGREDSFSAKVKEELLAVSAGNRRDRTAELAAVFHFTGADEGEELLLVSSENEGLTRKVFTLLEKLFNINLTMSSRRARHTGKLRYEIRTSDPKLRRTILRAVTDRDLLIKDGMRRAYLRGAFLSAGTINDPQKSYRLEIISRKEENADRILSVMAMIGAEGKKILRKNDYVVYLQEADPIACALGSMGAHRAYLELENVRILREMRGSIARKVNCETSNLNKTVQAAARQIREIRYLEETGVLKNLPDDLKETARLRLAYPDLSLTELGDMFTPPLGRSGINHRLRKLAQIASREHAQAEAHR